MSSDAVHVRGIGKRYQLGPTLERLQHSTLGESITSSARALWRGVWGRAEAARRPKDDHIWALHDVSFSVGVGEVVGIIGRNGAGKSTLLKILSRITKPTSGWAELRGRVASLLEVGTGFHPDLTGRDNIYLNGAILGLRRAEIDRRFDEIVAFSGVERFLDTPVKRYSSGMHVRLAFAVAAHLEPEILIVDEVLAVGDAEFQKKCLGKMQSVVRHGRTVLFVSHNMAAVKSLCSRAILLDAGRVVADGSVDAVVERYLDVAKGPSPGGVIGADAVRSGTGEARFRRVEVLDLEDRPVEELYFGQRFRVCMVVEVMQPVASAIAGVIVAALDGTEVACSFSTDRGTPPYALSPGWHVLAVDIDVALLPRTYTLGLTLNRTDGYDIDVVEQASRLSVLNVAATGTDSYPWPTLHGYVRAASSWRAPAPLEPGVAARLVSTGPPALHRSQGVP